MSCVEERNQTLMMFETEQARGLTDRAAGISQGTLDHLALAGFDVALQRETFPAVPHGFFVLRMQTSQGIQDELGTGNESSDAGWILRALQQPRRCPKDRAQLAGRHLLSQPF